MRHVGIYFWLGIAGFGSTAIGITLDNLRSDSTLSPLKLMRRVQRFDYELKAEIQAPEDFLRRERGDCDDFATLASLVLGEKKYTPRLISVRMPGVTHVVCYVSETRSYLDYNNRIYAFPLAKSGPEIQSIADKVSNSFDSSWVTASEFIYTNQVKILIKTIARTESFSEPAPDSTSSLPSTPPRKLDITF